jgi:hypothetical protein
MESFPLSDGDGAKTRVGLLVSLVLVPPDGDEGRRRQSLADGGHGVGDGKCVPVQKQEYVIGIRDLRNFRSEEVEASLVGTLRRYYAIKARVVLLVDSIQHGKHLEGLANISAEVALLYLNPFGRSEVDCGHVEHGQRVPTVRSFSIAPSEVFAQIGANGGHAGELSVHLPSTDPRRR